MRMLYFKHDNCRVCGAMLPKVERVATDHEVPLEVVDTVESPSIAGQHLVFAVPTILILDEDYELTRFARNFSMMDVEAFLARYRELTSN